MILRKNTLVFLFLAVLCGCAGPQERTVAQHDRQVCRAPSNFSEVQTLTFINERDVISRVHSKGIVLTEPLRGNRVEGYEIAVSANVLDKHQNVLPRTLSRKSDGRFHSIANSASYLVICYKTKEYCKNRSKEGCLRGRMEVDKDITECPLSLLSRVFTIGDICTEPSEEVPAQQ